MLTKALAERRRPPAFGEREAGPAARRRKRPPRGAARAEETSETAELPAYLAADGGADLVFEPLYITASPSLPLYQSSGEAEAGGSEAGEGETGASEAASEASASPAQDAEQSPSDANTSPAEEPEPAPKPPSDASEATTGQAEEPEQAPPAHVDRNGVIQFEADVITAGPPEAASVAATPPAEPGLASALAPVEATPSKISEPEEEVSGEPGAPPEPDETAEALEAEVAEGSEGAEPAAEDQAIEEQPPELETAEEEEAPEEAAEDEGGGGGGDGADDLATWRSKVAGATAATPQPELGEAPAEGAATVSGAGKSAAAKRRGGGGGGGAALTEDAKKAVRRPPETPKQLPPPPPTPVPAADKAIADASDKKLPDQSLPQLVQRPPDASVPNPTAPEMDTEFAADIGSKIDVPPDPAPEAPDKKSPNEKQVKKLKEAKAKEPPPGKKGKPGQPMTLTDTAPPPTPGVEVGTKGQSKEKVAQVLAELVRSPGPEGEAEKIVTEARGEAYPRKALEMECPEMGVDKKGDVLTELKAQVDSIRAIAGVSAAELDAAIKTREANLKALETGAKVEIETATKGAKKETKDSGEKMAEDIAGARDAVDEDTIQKMIAASGEADPKVIELRRDKAIRDLTSRAARQDVFYEQSGERRARALDAAKARMRNAYKKAAEADEKQIYDRIFAEERKAKVEATVAEKTATDRAKIEATPIFAWATSQVLALDLAFVTLKAEAATKTKKLRDGIKGALSTAKDMLRGWAEDRISRDESWLKKLIRKFKEWMREAVDDSAAWEAARNEQLRDALVGDLQLIDDLHAAAQRGVDTKAFVEERGLDQAQMAVLQTYVTPKGPEGKQQFDAIGAVAAGMRMRVRMARKPGLVSWFKSEVMGLPDSKWRLMGRIGNAEKPPFNVFGLASELHQAMDQWGTDEDQIFRALAGLTPLQARAIRACYKEKYKRSLDEHLESEMGGAEMTRAAALLEGNQTVADVATLYEAMHGGLTGAGTDEDAIMTVLRNKTPEEREAIVAEYKKRYGVDLNADLKSELDDGWGSDHDASRAEALMEGDTAKADAIALDAAMHGGLFGTGTDEAEITRVYEQNRAEVEAEAAQKGWSTAQMDAEIRRRNEAIEKKYEVKYGDPNKPKDQPSALRQAFAAELSGAELGLANALADADMTRIDAAKLGVEKESFITSDETVNKILQSQHERAKKDVTRDVNYDLRFREEMDSLRGQTWTPEKRKEEREKAEKEIKEQTKKRAMTYMGNLETSFDKDWGGGKGGLVLMIAFNMSGTDQQKAYDLRKQGGHLEPEQEIYYAVEGIGTDTDKLKEVLKGKSPAEIQKIRQAWVDRYGGKPEDFDDRILEEVSGRDYQDIAWGLEGEPETLDGKLARAKERMQYEKDAYGVWGDYKEERASIEEEYKYLEEEKDRLAKLEHLKADKQPGESDEAYAARKEKYAYWEDSFKLQQGYFDQSIENHRKAVDSFADTVATIASIVAVVVVMAVVAFFTAGTGAVAIGAALASAKVAAAAALAAAAATMASKALIKGSAYSREEIAMDAIVGAVDAVASAMTAGVGGGLLKAARAGAPASKLAAWAAKSRLATGLSKMATSERMAARMFAGAMAEGIEGVASSLPSALAGNMLDEKNWRKGNPLANILQGTAMQTGIGALVSGGMGGLGGIGKHVDDVADNLPAARETGDILAKRGSPADRLALWKGWKEQNPGKPYKEFLEQLDAGIIAREADDAAAHAMQRQMRSELLSAIPPSQRGEFADVPIHVMSDADFERFTRSATGQAVVIFKDGKPMVIMREGADIKALREEGVHLLQSKDPKFAGKFADLDERRLADWNKLGLDEQLALYRTKLDIELDGQARLIKSLDEQIASVKDPAVRKALMEQRDAAETTLGNLRKRLGEVDGLSPADRLKMARGEMSKPQYLDQKPRLFSKKWDEAAKIDPDLAGPLARRTAATDAKELIDKALAAIARGDSTGRVSSVMAQLNELWQTLGKRVRNILDVASTKITGGMTLAQVLDQTVKRPAFDATLALKSFIEVIKDLVDAKQLDRLEKFLGTMKRLLGRKDLDLGHFERFIGVASRVGNPDAMFDLVEKLASLTSFRKKGLKSVAGIIDNIAKHADDGPTRADKFVKELSDLAELTKKRDAISKADNRDLWEAAQKELDDAGAALKKRAGEFGIDEKEIGGVVEEMSKSGRFDWNVFKETLSEKYPLSGETFKPFVDMIEEIKTAIGKDWQDLDIGPLRWWRNLFEKLHTDEAGREALVTRIKKLLLEELPGLNLGGYGRYRRALKEQAIEYIVRGGSALDQLKRLKEIMTVVRERDPASIGEHFAAFRRKIFENGSTNEIKGELSGAVDVKLQSREVAGSTRQVDGALDVDIPEGTTITNGPRDSGRYFVEDKAGTSFSLDQAEFYSEQLNNGTFKTKDPGNAKGLIYFVEDPKRAGFIAGQIKDLNPNIFVATFGPDGKIRFVERPKGGIAE